jgi:hypothetical protein
MRVLSPRIEPPVRADGSTASTATLWPLPISHAERIDGGGLADAW